MAKRVSRRRTGRRTYRRKTGRRTSRRSSRRSSRRTRRRTSRRTARRRTARRTSRRMSRRMDRRTGPYSKQRGGAEPGSSYIIDPYQYPSAIPLKGRLFFQLPAQVRYPDSIERESFQLVTQSTVEQSYTAYIKSAKGFNQHKEKNPQAGVRETIKDFNSYAAQDYVDVIGKFVPGGEGTRSNRTSNQIMGLMGPDPGIISLPKGTLFNLTPGDGETPNYLYVRSEDVAEYELLVQEQGSQEPGSQGQGQVEQLSLPQDPSYGLSLQTGSPGSPRSPDSTPPLSPRSPRSPD